MKKPKNKEMAGLLSFIVPGIGQLYCGHWIWAILWLIFTAGIWAVTGPFGFIAHAIAGIQAYRQAGKKNRRRGFE